MLSLKYLRVTFFNFGTFELQICLLIFARERHSHVITFMTCYVVWNR